MAFAAPIKHARSRPKRIPCIQSGSYPEFKACQLAALRAAVHHLEQDLAGKSGVSHIEITNEELTVYLCSQSKLSQQELVDLQKATHFDKKELQQWYKGMSAARRHQVRLRR